MPARRRIGSGRGGGKLGSAYVELEMRLDSMGHQLKKANATIKTFLTQQDRAVTRHTKVVAGKIGQMMKRTVIAGGTIYGIYKLRQGLDAVVDSYLSFEKQMAQVSTMLDKQTMHYLPRYAQALKRLSVQYGDTRESLSKGLYDILSATFSPQKATGMLEVGARAGLAGLSDTGTAMSAIITILRAYKKDASEAADISDFLFSIVKRGRTTFAQLAPSIGTIASTAAIAKLSMEELGAAISTVTRAGISTDETITALNMVLLAFLKPQEDAIEAARKHKIMLSTQALEVEGLAGIMQKLNRLSAEELAKIFPRIRGLKGIAAALSDVSGFYEDVEQHTNRAGKSGEAYDKIAATTENRLERLRQAFGVAAINIGDRFVDMLGGVEAVNDALDIMTEKISKIGEISDRPRTKPKSINEVLAEVASGKFNSSKSTAPFMQQYVATWDLLAAGGIKESDINLPAYTWPHTPVPKGVSMVKVAENLKSLFQRAPAMLEAQQDVERLFASLSSSFAIKSPLRDNVQIPMRPAFDLTGGKQEGVLQESVEKRFEEIAKLRSKLSTDIKSITLDEFEYRKYVLRQEVEEYKKALNEQYEVLATEKEMMEEIGLSVPKGITDAIEQIMMLHKMATHYLPKAFAAIDKERIDEAKESLESLTLSTMTPMQRQQYDIEQFKKQFGILPASEKAKAKDALDKWSAMQDKERQKQILDMQISAYETLERRGKELNALYEEKIKYMREELTQLGMSEDAMDLMVEAFRRSVDQMEKDWDAFARHIGDTFQRTLDQLYGDFLKGDMSSWQEYLGGFMNEISMSVFRKNISAPISNAITGIMGGEKDKSVGPIFGKVGEGIASLFSKKPASPTATSATPTGGGSFDIAGMLSSAGSFLNLGAKPTGTNAAPTVAQANAMPKPAGDDNAGLKAGMNAAALAAAFIPVVGPFISAGLSVGSAFMADGGLVTKPTLATIGERGPEMVVPVRNTGNSAQPLSSFGNKIDNSSVHITKCTIYDKNDITKLIDKRAVKSNIDDGESDGPTRESTSQGKGML